MLGVGVDVGKSLSLNSSLLLSNFGQGHLQFHWGLIEMKGCLILFNFRVFGKQSNCLLFC